MILPPVSLMRVIHLCRALLLYVDELQSLLKQRQKNTVLWCNGVIAHASHKHKHSDDNDVSDNEQQPRKSKSKKYDTNVQQD